MEHFIDEKTIDMQEPAQHSEESIAEDHFPKLQQLVRTIFSKEFADRGLEEREFDVFKWSIVPSIGGKSSVHGAANMLGEVRFLAGLPLSRAIAVAVHEMTHVYSDRAYSEQSPGRYWATSGFGRVTTKRTGRESDSYRGLNEAVVHAYTIHLLEKYADEIKTQFPGVSLDALIAQSKGYYEKDRAMLEHVLQRMTDAHGDQQGTGGVHDTALIEKSRQRFFTFQFKSIQERLQLLHEAKQALPVGSVKILAALGRRSQNSERKDDEQSRAYVLFDEYIRPDTTTERRDRIATEVLPNAHQLYRYYMEVHSDTQSQRIHQIAAAVATIKASGRDSSKLRALRAPLEEERMRCVDMAKVTREHMRDYFRARTHRWFSMLGQISSSDIPPERREEICKSIFGTLWTLHQYDTFFPKNDRCDDDTVRYFGSSVQHLSLSERRQLTMIYEEVENAYPVLKHLLKLRVQIQAIQQDIDALAT